MLTNVAFCSLWQRGQDNEFWGKGILALLTEISSLENEGFWQHISVSLTVYWEEKKKMEKEERSPTWPRIVSMRPVVVYLCVFGSIESIVYRIIRHPHGPAMNANCDNVSVQPKWKCKTLTDYQWLWLTRGADHAAARSQVTPGKQWSQWSSPTIKWVIWNSFI